MTAKTNPVHVNGIGPLKRAIYGRGSIVRPGDDGLFGVSVTVRTTSRAETIERLARECGASVIDRSVTTRAWNTSSMDPARRRVRSQAIRLVIVGATAEQDAELCRARAS